MASRSLERLTVRFVTFSPGYAVYLAPAVGEVEAYLVLPVGRLHSAHEPAPTSVLVTPRRVGDATLVANVSARWSGWRDVDGAICLLDAWVQVEGVGGSGGLHAEALDSGEDGGDGDGNEG